MDIQRIPISQIKTAPYNPRKDLKPGDPEYEKLKKSLAEFDLVEPLIWNKRSHNLVGGHQRLKVIQERGDKEVQVSVVDLTPAKEKALNLALNKISGEWDYPLLKNLLEELDNGEFDIEITGFDEKEIEDLMTQFHVPEEGLTPDDDIPEQVETACKKGDLWKLGDHRLLCGDSPNDYSLLPGIEDVALVLTDPPYGIDIVKGVSPADSGGAKPFGRVRQPGGHPAGVLKGSTGSLRYLSKSFRQGRLRGPGVVEPRLYRPVEGDDKPFDPSWLLSIGKTQIIWGGNYCASKLPDRKAWICWDKGVSPESTFSGCELAWTSLEGHLRLYRHTWSGMVREGDRKEELQDRVHPTQKPVGLMAAILLDYSKQCDYVFDPYGGSGSTLIACEKTERRCLMCEIEPYYVGVIIQRWQKFTGKTAELLKE